MLGNSAFMVTIICIIAICLGILLHLGLSYYTFKVRICIHIAAPSNRLRSRPLHNTKRWCPDFGISLKSTALFLSIKSGYTCASCLITGMWTSSLVLASGHSTGVIFCFHVLETYVRMKSGEACKRSFFAFWVPSHQLHSTTNSHLYQHSHGS